MKLIIEVDEKRYEEIKLIANAQLELKNKTEAQIIASGTPYDPSGDLISRGVAINLLNEAQVEYDEYYKGLGKAKTIIDNAPPVKFSLLPADESKEVAYMRGYNHGFTEGILKAHARPQGEWISRRDANGIINDYCSECGTKAQIGYVEFCGKCGADMRKGGAK